MVHPVRQDFVHEHEIRISDQYATNELLPLYFQMVRMQSKKHKDKNSIEKANDLSLTIHL